MLTAYIACLGVGGVLLVLSLFGDFLEGDADLAVDADATAASEAASAIFSVRTFVYGLFGFGAAGTALHLFWDGGGPLGAALAAAGTGLVSGALASVVFRYLRRTEAGLMEGEEAFVGTAGRVALEIGPDSPGLVRLRRGDRRIRVRARLAAAAVGETLAEGREVVVVEMKDGVAAVTAVNAKLLED